MKVKLSICIVLYKNYIDAIEAVKSIEEYTSNHFSKVIYLVDNSPENSYGIDELLKSIKKYGDIVYLTTGKNLGFGKGQNYVIDRLESQYHAIINPDILLIKDSFSKIIEYLDKREDIGAVIPLIVDENDKLQPVYREELTVVDIFIRMFCKNLFPKRIAEHSMQYMDYTKEFQVPFGQGSFLVFRTKLFQELKGFDDNFFMYVEDADLCKRVNQISKLMYFPGTKVIHKWKKGSHKDVMLLKHHVQSMGYYFKKWGLKLY